MYKEVDIVECLKNIFYKTAKEHETDFKFDILRILNEAKKAKDEGAPRHLLWMARKNGTWCFPEGNVYIEGTPERKLWLAYQREPESISAFSVEIIGVKNNTAIGNVRELAYAEHVKQVQKHNFIMRSIDLELKNGERVCIQADKFNFYAVKLGFECIASISYIIKEDEQKFLDFLKDIHNQNAK